MIATFFILCPLPGIEQIFVNCFLPQWSGSARQFNLSIARDPAESNRERGGGASGKT